MTGVGYDFARRVTLASRHAWNWVARTAKLDALSEQVGRVTRTTTATGTDSFAAPYTAVHSEATLTYHAGQDLVGLLLGPDDSADWTVPILPQASCGMVRFIENGTLAIASAGVFYIGLDAATGARLYIDSTGTQYRLTYHDGSTPVTSTMSGTAPTTGQLVELRWRLAADGKVKLWQTINSGAETAATESAGLTLAAAWGATTVRLNSVGTANKGNNLFLGAVLDPGDLSIDLLRAAAS